MQEAPFHVGDTRITKVLDLYLNHFTAEQLLVGLDPDTLTNRPRCVRFKNLRFGER